MLDTANKLISGTTLRVGQQVSYHGSIAAIDFGRCWQYGTIIGPKRSRVVVDFGTLGEYECQASNLVARDDLEG